VKILVDENIPAMTVSELRRLGHDVLDVRGTQKEGASDSEVWNLAQKENRLLITTDKGFAQIRQSEHEGILIIRLRQPNRHKIHQRVIQAIDHIPAADWAGKAVIMRDKTMIVT
jgi:predicted nuclease of predicted toxin-antitoxin system